MLLEGILKKIFGDPNEKEIKNIRVIVDKINSLEKDMESLSSANLAAKTSEFKVRLQKGETLDDIFPEAFAVVREASRRVTGMRHFDVQLIGGVVLHRGKIAEMRTGEGKTLVATAPVYLNALTGKGVHVVTVNDYLARRDSEDMGRIYKFLGLSVGLIVHDMDFPDRKAAYAALDTRVTANATKIQEFALSIQDAVNTVKNELQAKIDALQTEVNANKANIQRNTDRLNDQITKEAEDYAELKGMVNAEAEARANADTNLKSQVDKVNIDLNTEVSKREAGDTVLQQNIDKEISDRTSADTLLDRKSTRLNSSHT